MMKDTALIKYVHQLLSTATGASDLGRIKYA